MVPSPKRQRPRLSRERVFEAAVSVADARGVAAVTMRNVAEQLGIEAMSLYHHVANKDKILDGIVDLVFAQIELPDDGSDWKNAMYRRAASARAVLSRHPWALGLMESRRNPGPATLRHHDWMIGRLRTAGFSIRLVAHAISAIDAYVYGFVLQESTLPFSTTEELKDVSAGIVEQLPAAGYPHLAEMFEHALRPGYSYAEEFAFGLELVLDGLERAFTEASGSPRQG